MAPLNCSSFKVYLTCQNSTSPVSAHPLPSGDADVKCTELSCVSAVTLSWIKWTSAQTQFYTLTSITCTVKVNVNAGKRRHQAQPNGWTRGSCQSCLPLSQKCLCITCVYLLFPQGKLQVKSDVKCREKKREEKAEYGLKDLILCDIERNMSATSSALSQLTCQLLLLDLVLLL